jgi:hypothetical protein
MFIFTTAFHSSLSSFIFFFFSYIHVYVYSFNACISPVNNTQCYKHMFNNMHCTCGLLIVNITICRCLYQGFANMLQERVMKMCGDEEEWKAVLKMNMCYEIQCA